MGLVVFLSDWLKLTTAILACQAVRIHKQISTRYRVHTYLKPRPPDTKGGVLRRKEVAVTKAYTKGTLPSMTRRAVT